MWRYFKEMRRPMQFLRNFYSCFLTLPYKSCNEGVLNFFHVPNKRFSSEVISTLYVSGRHAQTIYSILKPCLETDYIINNKNEIQINCKERNIKVDVSNIIDRLVVWKGLNSDIEAIKIQKAELENDSKLPKESEKYTRICESIQVLKTMLWDCEDEIVPSILILPNRTHPETPVSDEVIAYNMSIPNFRFKDKCHVALGKHTSCIEFVSVSPMAYYLKGKLAILETAIQHYFSDQLQCAEFIPLSCTDFSKSFVIEGCGKDPFSCTDCIEVKTEESVGQKLHLVGASSLETFCSYYTRMNINKASLPAKYFCLGRQYNSKQGNGQYPSLFSVIQSTSIHCFILSEMCDSNFVELYNIFFNCFTLLNIPFRTVKIAVKNLNVSECRRIQFEMWSPSLKKYVLCSSISQHDDFISKRLQMSYGSGTVKQGYLHMIDGCAVIVPTLIACIMENLQTAENDYSIPNVLQRYMME